MVRVAPHSARPDASRALETHALVRGFRNGWTGGQASLLRAFVGLWLAGELLALLRHAGAIATAAADPDRVIGFATLGIPNVLAAAPSTGLVIALACSGVVLSVGVALGWRVRWLVLPLAYLWGCLFGVARAGWPAGLVLVGWLPVVFALAPPAPFGSVAARGRPDPGGGWRLSPERFALAWAVLAAVLVGVATWRLMDPAWRDAAGWMGGVAWAICLVYLAVPLLMPLPVLRPGLWGLTLVGELFAALYVGLEPLGFAGLALHLLTFDPGWIPAKAARPGGAPERVFYDGACGLCHRTVRFILAEDRAPGGSLRLAPLDSDAFAATIPAGERAALPDSLVVARGDGSILTRSAGVLWIAARLGGVWRALAAIARLIPRPLRDLAYDGVAAVRHRLFPKPDDACPLIPPGLRDRFDG